MCTCDVLVCVIMSRFSSESDDNGVDTWLMLAIPGCGVDGEIRVRQASPGAWCQPGALLCVGRE